jgi:hypothetical protein
MDNTGYLGYWHDGSFVIAIHANWPTYPGPGKGNALYDMCQFPHGTAFSPIDDIDRCVLFIASSDLPNKGNRSKDNFYIAAWHSDLIALADNSLIEGIITASEIEWRKAQRETERADLRDNLEAELSRLGIEGAVIEGDPLDLGYATVGKDEYPLSDFYSRIETDALLEELDGQAIKDRVVFDTQRPVIVTPKGWAELERLLREDPVLARFERLCKLVDTGLYDAAIRDAGALLETTLRQATGSSEYGIRLANLFIKQLEADKRWPNSTVKRFSTDLRTAFKFVRNEFAHQIVDVPHDRALALLVRLASLIESVKESG